MARTVDLLALIGADWRRLVGWLLGGWAVFAIVLMLALGYLGCRGCPPGTVDRFIEATGIDIESGREDEKEGYYLLLASPTQDEDRRQARRAQPLVAGHHEQDQQRGHGELSPERLLDGLDRHWPAQRLKWFTQGFYSVERLGNAIVITDLRMGLEPNYVFSFKVGQMGNPHAIPSKSERVFGERGWEQLNWVWQRIWTDNPEVARYRGNKSSI